MQIHHKPTKILTIGCSGSGKTTFVIRFVEVADEYEYKFIFDHKREFQVRMGIEPCANVEEMLERIEKGERTISFAPDVEWPGQKEDAFQFFAEWVFEMAKALQTSCLFVCDEVNRLTNVNNLGWEFKQLIEDGRLQGLDFIGTAHNANRISGDLRAQITEIICFRTVDRLPLEFVEECGFDPEEVSKLGLGEYISRNTETGEIKRGRLFSKKSKPPAEPEEEAEEGDPEDNTSIDNNAEEDHMGDSDPPP